MTAEEEEEEEGGQNEEEEDSEDELMTEVRFVPEEKELLNPMYQALQECSLLHPDPVSDMTGT